MVVEAIESPSGKKTFRVYSESGLPVQDINSYLRNRDLRGYAVSSIKAYANDLKLYFEWLENSNYHWHEVNQDVLISYINCLKNGWASNNSNKRLSLTSLKRRLSTINSFYRFQFYVTGMYVKPLLYANVTKGGKKGIFAHVNKSYTVLSMTEKMVNEPEKINGKTLNQSEFLSLINFLSNQRDRLFFTLLWETGMRVGQALQLMHEDINHAESKITIKYREDNPNGVFSKSRRTYDVYVPSSWIKSYINYLIEDSDLYDSNYVFCAIYHHNRNRRNTPLSYEYYKKIFKDFSQYLNRDITIHSLRHSYITRCIKNKVPIEFVSRQVGHQSIETTKKVYEHLSIEDLRNELMEKLK